MPISDNPAYPEGHFNRVYEYIIKPACEIAGFTPIRADEVVSTNYIALDIIKRIIEADIAICDLSSQNPNVLYELGIRQAFNKPVVLMKDNMTKRIFDIQGFRDVEYDSSLRIDNVNACTELLAKTLKNTYENKEIEINSLVKLLSISPAEVTESTKISLESELILNQLNIVSRRLEKLEFSKLSGQSNSMITNKILDENMDFEKDFENTLKLQPGDKVIHPRFGTGVVKKIHIPDNIMNTTIEIKFEIGGTKKLMLRFTKLKKLYDIIED